MARRFTGRVHHIDLSKKGFLGMTPKLRIPENYDSVPHVPVPQKIDEEKLGGLCQYTTADGIKFFPASRTRDTLPPGVYEISYCNMKGVYFERIPIKTDDLIRFPETNSEKVIEEIQKFWGREDVFRQFGLSYRRGILLYGPPGSGKSCTIRLIMNDVVKRDGVVLKFRDPGLFCNGIRLLREIQPSTPVVVLMEDIDSTIEAYSESEVLNILDGVEQVEKVVYLATTNYPERLGARIINRPSRFDKRIKMAHPKSASRRLYFEHLMNPDVVEQYEIDLDRWVKDTEKMSIAHLKELFISVCIFGNEYDEAIKTLQEMLKEKPQSGEDYDMNIGFGR